MKTIFIKSRNDWRKWLTNNHDKEKKGIWLEFLKKNKEKQTLEYEDAVEEALCFGWIDSIIKKIDEEKYCRKFTPRKLDSKWSELNKKRVEKMITKGKITKHGLKKVQAAKKSGIWDKDESIEINLEVPEELEAALNKNPGTKEFFDQLADTYRKHYIAWIKTAKKQATKDKRVKESISLLKKRKKLGLR